MIHTILTAVDRNSKSEANAVVVQLIDWQSAFDRQCQCPLLINYFQNRQMAVKWKGKFSQPRPLPGGGAQGGTLGGLEYLSQTNHNVDFMDKY